MPPSAVHAFYASEIPSNTLNEEHTSKNAQEAHIALLKHEAGLSNSQSNDAAVNAFYGIDEVHDDSSVPKLGEPIPGYSGVNRRVTADNVFGMTYAEARRCAGESLARIDAEKSETLRETSTWDQTKF